eukprot:Hpha_TRINITY_DN16246_c1_g6::TRINITY_DN16246_c1_g6_i1::g.13056::m.13056
MVAGLSARQVEGVQRSWQQLDPIPMIPPLLQGEVGALVQVLSDVRGTQGLLERIAYVHAAAHQAEGAYVEATDALLAGLGGMLRGRTGDEVRQSWTQICTLWCSVLTTTHRSVVSGEPVPVGALDLVSPVEVYRRAAAEQRLPRLNAELTRQLRATPTFTTLEEIDIKGSYVGNKGLAALLWVIERATSLRRLGLRSACLYSRVKDPNTKGGSGSPTKGESGVDGNVVVAGLCQALVKGNSVVTVDLSDNGLAAQAGRQLLYVCENVRSMLELDLSETLVPQRLLIECEKALARNRDARRRHLESQSRRRNLNTVPVSSKTPEQTALLTNACQRSGVLCGWGEKEDAVLVQAFVERPPIPPGSSVTLGLGEIGLLVRGELLGAEGRFSAGWCFGLYPLRDPGPWSRGRVEAATPVVSPSSPVDNLSFDIAAGLADVPTWTNSGTEPAYWWCLPRVAAVATAWSFVRQVVTGREELIPSLPDSHTLSLSSKQQMLTVFKQRPLPRGKRVECSSTSVLFVLEGIVEVSDSMGDRQISRQSFHVGQGVLASERPASVSTPAGLQTPGDFTIRGTVRVVVALVADGEVLARIPGGKAVLRALIARNTPTPSQAEPEPTPR